ncbi:MAG: UDP-2,3-diacylglucosamine diphosphatase [Fimbriimonadaceae bacterium]|nr:MAG: UDP-2,3-diacylglucosamine diphosphatase [Fimbriimonadaceae bacterium]
MTDPLFAYRSLFISDLHLGSAGCMVDELQAFLESVDCENLYIVGDLIDLYVVMKAGKWRQEHTEVVRSILEKSKEGTRIFYTPGNHDAFLRRLNGSDFGNIRIDHQVVHELADGRRLLVIHGDQFDRSVKFVPLAWIATWVYEGMTVLTGLVNAKRKQAGKEPTDFSGGMKKRLKKYVSRNSGADEALVNLARSMGLQGVICGHTHRPGITLDEEGMLYVNTGDWVEHGTAVAEHDDGRLELIVWNDVRHLYAGPPATVLTRTPVKRRRLFRVRRGRIFGWSSNSTRRSA